MRHEYKKICIVCGKYYITEGSRSLTCGVECKKKHDRARVGYYDAGNPIRSRAQESLTEVTKKAKEAGMSYGQYVLKMGERHV